MSSRHKAKGSVGAPKYRDPATGATWTGRGKPPNWINGKVRESFLIIS
ncbi:MAG: H-NS family nucleoid-associated regulatory protein [Pseudomonadales bacterium]